MKKCIGLTVMILCVFCLCACGNSTKRDGTDVTLADVKKANRFETLMEEYDSIYIKEESVEVNGSVYNTVYWNFSMDDDGPVADTWVTIGDESMTVNARAGVLYQVNNDKMTATIIPKPEYKRRIEKLVPFFPSDSEELVSVAEMKENKEIIVETSFENPVSGDTMGGTYFLDAKTLHIKRVQIATYNERGLKINIRAMEMTYDGHETSNTDAWKAIRKSKTEDSCKVTVVIEPGSEGEEKRTLEVTKGCDIKVLGSQEYELYSDEACEIQIFTVDTMGDGITVYAKPVE